MGKSIAEQIADLNALKQSGALSEQEFSLAKAKLLGSLNERSGDSVGDSLASAADAVTGAFSNALSDSSASYKNLLWILYWGTVGVNLVSFLPVFAWVSFIAGIGIVVVAVLKMAPSAGTIYNSHFRNIVVIAVVSLVGYFILLVVTVGTLGIGIIVTGPLFIALMIWYVYRLVKGMMRLNEGKAV